LPGTAIVTFKRIGHHRVHPGFYCEPVVVGITKLQPFSTERYRAVQWRTYFSIKRRQHRLLLTLKQRSKATRPSTSRDISEHRLLM
jgi:hypothetical protein